MRIVVNGQQAFGAEVLKALVERGEEVVAAFCAPDKEGRPRDPLADAADEAGIPVHQPASFKDEETARQIAALEPDLMVMAFVTLIVPESVLSIPTHGAIQYHPSILPRHRGPSAINWAIIQGDTTTGLSIFWPDEGLDTGPVLLTREVAIEDDDTLGSLYFDKLFPMGVEAMVESVDLVRDGEAPRIVQDEALATYEGWCGHDQAEIDWAQPARQVHDLIRGCTPRPGAWTTLAGEEIGINGSRPTTGEGRPGEVLSVGGDDGFVVATANGAVTVTGVRAEGDKLSGSEYAERAGLRPGTVLGEP
jgi:methionyl-tRNA formyltransferase